MTRWIFLISAVLLFAGCAEMHRHEIPGKVAMVATEIGKVEYTGDEFIDILKSVQAGSTAATPFLPYAGILAAISTAALAWTDANRRQEKSKRKWAEGELDKKNGSG